MRLSRRSYHAKAQANRASGDRRCRSSASASGTSAHTTAPRREAAALRSLVLARPGAESVRALYMRL
jgi:hypothetical protein